MEPESPSIFSNLWIIGIGTALAAILIGGAFWRWWDNKRGKNIDLDSDPNKIKATLIAGKWRTSFKEDEQEFNENVEIHIDGNEVWGTIDLIDLNDPSLITDSYKLKGKYMDRILAGTYESNDPTDYEQGAFVLELRGRIFTGKYLFGTKKEGEEPIASSPYIWERIK